MSCLLRIGLALLLFAFLGAVRAGEAGGAPGATRSMSFKWKVKATYPVIGVARVDEQIRDWLNAQLAAALGEAKDLADVDVSEGFWEMGVTPAVTKPTDRVVSVVLTVYAYAYGAAHPSSWTIGKHYSLDTGEEYTLDTLFKDPDAALAIFARHAPGIISDEFRRTHAADFPRGLAREDWFEDGFKPSRDNYEVIGLEKEGVRLHFQQYQILPYAFGMPSPLIPLELLEPAGPNREVWPGK